MPFFVTAAVSALSALNGLFTLTIVPKNSQGPWQTNIVPVSRGVPALNTVNKSNQTFIWDEKFSKGQGIYFTSEGGMPEDGQWLLEQNLVDCAAYLVKEGYTGADVYQWSSQPPNASWTQPAYCAEPGSEDVNVAVRIDLQ